LAKSKEAKEQLNIKQEDYNDVVGFIGLEKGNKYLVFKTKDIFAKRNKGARCDESGKEKTMAKLNKIIGKDVYTKESTKAQKNEDGIVIHEAIGQPELCVLQEFLLRYFNKTKKNDKIWFVTPEMAIYQKF